jgi:hypothetical protein
VLFSGGGLGWFWFVLGSSCCQVVWSWLCFAVLGLPLVMEGDYGNFDEKSFHPKSPKDILFVSFIRAYPI